MLRPNNLTLFLYLAPPLFVIEFLHRVVDILEQYFSECNESNIKEHYVVVYEVCIWTFWKNFKNSQPESLTINMCTVKFANFSIY